MLEKKMYQAGFHDPLMTLLKSNSVYHVSTEGLRYTDIDDKKDIPKAKHIFNKVLLEENNG